MPTPPIADAQYPELMPILVDEIGRSIDVRMFVPDALADVPRIRAARDQILMMTSTGDEEG